MIEDHEPPSPQPPPTEEVLDDTQEEVKVTKVSAKGESIEILEAKSYDEAPEVNEKEENEDEPQVGDDWAIWKISDGGFECPPEPRKPFISAIFESL